MSPRWPLLMILAVALCACRPWANEGDATAVIRPAIVQIGLRSTNELAVSNVNLGRRVAGTGFIVNEEGYIVTAAHVVEGLNELLARHPAILEPAVRIGFENKELSRGNRLQKVVSIVDSDVEHDVALLKLAEPVSSIKEVAFESRSLVGIAKLAPNRPREGQDIRISGYPFDSPVMITTSGRIASSWTVNDEEIPSEVVPSRTRTVRREYYLGDITINPGNSGGPVYDGVTGAVIGVGVGQSLRPVELVDTKTKKRPAPFKFQDGNWLGYAAGLANIVPIEHAIALLKKHNASWTQE